MKIHTTLLSLLLCISSAVILAQDIKKARPLVPINVPMEEVRSEKLEPRRKKEKVSPLKVEQYTLPNGMTVYLNEDPNLPSVYGGVAVNAGGKYDPRDATGMGHYLEHMLFKGNQQFGTSDFQKEKPYLDRIIGLYDSLGMTTDEKQRAAIQKTINEVGVQAAEFAIPNELDKMLKSFGSTGVNAFTSFDLIFYHNTFPASEMEKWLTIYADRFQNPVFRLFQSELEVVYEEKNRQSDNFVGGLFDVVLNNLFKKHPYGQGVIGLTEHLKNPSLRKMYEYYNTYYVPGNMALVLCGDFDSEKIKPMIQEHFGKWQSKPVPAFNAPKEEPFKGRENVKTNLTPIPIGIMGFRAVPNGHPDQYAVELIRQLLSNSSQTGLLDKLTTDRKLMACQMFPLQLNDEGMIIFFFVPKILKQSIANAEKLILGEIDKIKKGDISDTQLEAAKKQLRIAFYKSLEENESRGVQLANLFTQKTGWEDYLKYPEKIDALTKKDIQAIAGKYLGENYMLIESRTGFPKKDKLAKPGFKPVIPKDGVESPYVQNFNKIRSDKVENPFTDWQTEVLQKAEVGKGLYVSKNPVNQIFTFTIRYPYSNIQHPSADKMVEYMGLVGSKNMPFAVLRGKLDSLGCTLGLEADAEHTEISLTGMEKDLEAGMKLLGMMMREPEVNQDKIKNLSEGAMLEPRLFKREKEQVAGALKEYAMYGKEQSAYCKRLTAKELKALKAENLAQEFVQMTQTKPEYFYTGNMDPVLLTNLIQKHLPQGTANVETYDRKALAYTENTVLLLDDKKARQSHLFIYVLGSPHSIKEEAAQDAFNSYFGGDMSSLMFQEIREFRSLAYAARGTYNKSQTAQDKDYFMGYIGCQGDKTMEALETITKMLKDMPAKPDRMNAIRSGLIAKIPSNKPDFRERAMRVADWKAFGYEEDPNRLKAEIYPKLQFTDIQRFYQNHLQNRPIVYCIVGNADTFDKTKLAQYGKIKTVKMGDIYRE